MSVLLEKKDFACVHVFLVHVFFFVRTICLANCIKSSAPPSLCMADKRGVVVELAVVAHQCTA